ncbi:hypothetical protein KFL_000620080 [Klebsormidium nitens]|uniref:PCI domain-containing protein n=1 Tax=Klebsormidium nitens TaxID=105231 RepID=A0A1Y1HQ61_KLENI|nr:hypothetical protein KFL_000620080 [Klebsormidium nitens]|eukprot:GAQ80774.1 hypothetical protein KFL_000620080 [Klebsormidium nitens]
MEVEGRQVALVEQFVLLAKNVRGRGAAEIVKQATCEPGLFAFGELLDTPSIQELQGSEHAAALDLLRLFAHGTWTDYKNHASSLPPLTPPQILKLKQLTVMSLAENSKTLPYDLLSNELDISNTRELEDFVINDCMYTGILDAKLDQRQRRVEVQASAGRDIRPGQLQIMAGALEDWLKTSEELLQTIQEKVTYAERLSEEHRKHKAEVDARKDEATKSLKSETEQPAHDFGDPSAMEYVEEERVRPKRSLKRLAKALS